MSDRVLVLAYHSHNVSGQDYASNDQVAFAEDLRQLTVNGYSLVSLSDVADMLDRHVELPARAVALTCDDGPETDFHGVADPRFGLLPGLAAILDQQRRQGRFSVGFAPLTAFVIADPEARREMEQVCLDGRPWLGQSWWQGALTSGLIQIGNHGWDHRHPQLARYRQLSDAAAGFAAVRDRDAADFQIAQACAYLGHHAPGPGLVSFAYPFGHADDYLSESYLPEHGPGLGLRAAYTTEPEAVHRGSYRWRLPRFVCGAHWRSPEEFAALLRSAP